MHNQGIHVYESAPHTPQQNGWAEWFIHTLMDKAQVMHLHTCLPDSYWEFAVQHAVHVYNCTPKQGLNWKTPHELLFKASPMISHLCIFKCTAYVDLPVDIHREKLQPKSQLMIYLGMVPGCHIHDTLSTTPALQAHLPSWSSDLWCYLAQSVSPDLQTLSPFLRLLCTLWLQYALFYISISSALWIPPCCVHCSGFCPSGAQFWLLYIPFSDLLIHSTSIINAMFLHSI